MSYIGNSPGVASQRIVTIRTATAGQTEFFPDSGYVLGYIDVIIGGVDMTPGVDYTANDGVKVVLTEAAEAGEIVKLIAYIPRGLSDGYLKSEADALLALKADLVGGKIPSAQLPAYVDDVLEFDNLASFPATGEFGKIYVDKTTNATYRWSGSTYIVLTDLSAYYTSAQVNSALALKADKSTTYTKTETDNLLSSKANTTDVNTALALKANTTDVNTALALKQNNLGFTPVNKAGDTMTGSLHVQGIIVTGGSDLILKAQTGSSDSGDIQFTDGGGNELHRLYSGTNTLLYRTAGGTGYDMLHAGHKMMNVPFIRKQIVNRRVLFGVGTITDQTDHYVYNSDIINNAYGPFGYNVPVVQPGAERRFRIYAVYSDSSQNQGDIGLYFRPNDSATDQVLFSLGSTWGGLGASNRDGFSNEIIGTPSFGGTHCTIRVGSPNATTNFGVRFHYIELQTLDVFI